MRREEKWKIGERKLLASSNLNGSIIKIGWGLKDDLEIALSTGKMALNIQKRVCIYLKRSQCKEHMKIFFSNFVKETA